MRPPSGKGRARVTDCSPRPEKAIDHWGAPSGESWATKPSVSSVLGRVGSEPRVRLPAKAPAARTPPSGVGARLVVRWL
ncbi:MAG: hypothetical protein R3F14_33880 [Polyangiaceae bacterium]